MNPKFLEFRVMGEGYFLIFRKNGKRENIDSWWGLITYTFSRKYACSKVQSIQILRDVGAFKYMVRRIQRDVGGGGSGGWPTAFVPYENWKFPYTACVQGGRGSPNCYVRAI